MPAKSLRVRVVEAGQRKVDLTFKAAMAERLAELMPPELLDKVQAQGLDVSAIALQAVQGDFAPGELFQLTEGAKQVRVWLE